MADVARSKGFTVETSRFEEWDACGRLFDGVVSGQAWHWVDPILGARKAASILRPGGRLALFWNSAQPPLELAAQFARVFNSLDTGLNRLAKVKLDALLGGIGAVIDAAGGELVVDYTTVVAVAMRLPPRP